MATKVQGTKNRRAVQIQETEVLNTVKGLNLDSVSRSITETQVEVQKVLADLSSRVLDRLQELQNVEDAIRLKKEEMKQLHDIEIHATTLDELEAQIREQRRSWDEEQAGKKREFAEMQSERNKQWKREEEEYQYRLAQEHLKQKDTLATVLGQQEKANREKQELLDRSWAEREAELKRREQDLIDLRKFRDDAPDMVRKEVNAQVAIATNSVKKEYETRMMLAAKDAETEKRLAELQVQGLQQTVVKMQTQLDDLKRDLELAHQGAKEIAGKALDSASGRATTEALQRLMEKEQMSGKQSK